MKHLRYLMIVFCFAILPAVITDRGVNYYTEYELAQRVESTERKLSELLRNTIYLYETGNERKQVIEELQNQFRELEPINAETVSEWRQKVYSEFGEIFRLVIFYSAQGTGEARIADLPEDLKYSFLFKKLDEYLSREPIARESFNKSQQRMIEQRLLGRDGPTLNGFKLHDPQVYSISNDGRYTSLSWLHGKEGQARNLFLLQDTEASARRFSLERLLARVSLDQVEEGIRQEILPNSDTADVALLSNNPQLKPLIQSPPHMNITLVGDESIFAIYPLLDHQGNRRLIAAHQPLDRVYPGHDGFVFWSWILAWGFAGLFIVVYGLVHYGRLRLFISIRLQLVAILFLASVLPLSALFVMGIQYLQSYREMLIQDTFDMMDNRIHRLDEDMVVQREKMRQLAVDVLEKEATADTLRMIQEVDLSNWSEDRRKQHHEQFLNDTLKNFNNRLRELRAQELVYDWWIYAPDGGLYFSYDKSVNVNERMIIGRIANQMSDHFWKGTPPVRKLSLEEEFFNQLLFSYKDFIVKDIVEDVRQIHPVKLMRIDWKLFMHPIFGRDGQPVAVMTLNFNMDQFKAERARNLVQEQAKEESPLRFAARGSYYQWGQNERHLDEMDSVPPELNDRLSGLFALVAQQQIPQRRIIPAGKEEYLITCLPLREMDDFFFAGFYPISEVDRAVGRLRAIFLSVCLLSLFLAVFIALVVSAKFIRPVRSVQSGVRAIAEGDLTYRMQIDSQDELGELSRTFNRMVGGLQEKERMSRYVSEFVLDEVKKDTSDEGQGEEKKATVLFTDIRGFTTLSEKYPPGEIVAMLNDYLDVMTRVILANGGVIDKFIGDAIMAVFYPDHPKGARSDESRAVLASLQMRAELVRFNERRRAAGKFEVDNGIGVNTGEVIRGSIGSQEHRVDLTVIGDHVNIAARLEGLSKEGQHSHIILSERTCAAVSDFVDTVPFGTHTVKGKTKSVALYEVVGLRTAAEYLPRLLDENPTVRREGLRLLSVVADPTSLAAVLERLEDEDSGVRSEAAVTLGQLVGTSTEAMDHLADRLQRETDARVIANLIRVIGEAGPDRLRLSLHPWLEHEDPRVRANTVEAMGQAADRAGLIKVLSVYRGDENNRIRANACVMLWSLGVADVVVDLLAMINDRQVLMRASGAWGIGEIAGRERVAKMRAAAGQSGADLDASLFERLDNCLDGLHRLLDDSDAMVMRNAIKALGRMGNRQSSHRLIRKYQEIQDEEIRLIILGALDEIGAGHIVREARHGVTGGRV